MTKRSRKYIQVYKKHFGEIPKDEMGRSYDIHHIDGDHTNNDPSNLVALSIRDHYEIHKKQGDFGAAWKILSRITIDPQEVSEIIRNMNLSNAEKGIHWSQLASKKGMHPFQNREFQKYMAVQAKLMGNRAVDKIWTCETCGRSGKGSSNYTRYHGENCGKNSESKGRIWINNGLTSKMVNKDVLNIHISQGWMLGRGSSEITARRKNANGLSGRAETYVRKTSRSYNKKPK